METRTQKLVIRTDRAAITSGLIKSMIVALILLVVLVSRGIPDDELRFYSRGSDSIETITGELALVISSIGFVVVLIFLLVVLYIIRILLIERKELPIIYTFTEKGFRSHALNKEFSWQDFETFYHPVKGDHILCLPLKHPSKSTIRLNSKEISKTAYWYVINHLKIYAPQVLTIGINIPN